MRSDLFRASTVGPYGRLVRRGRLDGDSPPSSTSGSMWLIRGTSVSMAAQLACAIASGEASADGKGNAAAPTALLLAEARKCFASRARRTSDLSHWEVP